MNRRGLLSALAAAAGAFALDPDRALWVPGAKRFFIPRLREVRTVRIQINEFLRVGDRFSIEGYVGDWIVMDDYVPSADGEGGSLAIQPWSIRREYK